MGSAKSKVDNEIMSETINKTMNSTTMSMVNDTKISQTELNNINQSIKLTSPAETLLAMQAEAGRVAALVCKGEDQVAKCVTDIIDSMVPPACGDGLTIRQSADIESESSAKLKSVDTAQLEQSMKEALKTAYDNSQDGSAEAEPGVVGHGESDVSNKVSTKVVNETINEIAMEMRNEVEMFQKKNNNVNQAIEVEMFPGMSKGACDFSTDAAIKSVSNIGAAKAMQIIGDISSDISKESTSSTDQKASAVAKGPKLPSIMDLLAPLMVPIIGIVVVIVVIKALGSMPSSKKGGGGGQGGPQGGPQGRQQGGGQGGPQGGPQGGGFVPTPPASKFQVGQVITLANGQKALIQGFGKWKRVA